jgi:hypothetical protein
MIPRLQTKYSAEVVPALKAKRGYENPHQVPRIEKIVINMGVRSDAEKGSIEEAVKELGMITGRKPVITKGKEEYRKLQVASGPKRGLQGDAQAGCDVRVLGQVDHCGPAKDPRFPWHLFKEVRRSRDLFIGTS